MLLRSNSPHTSRNCPMQRTVPPFPHVRTHHSSTSQSRHHSLPSGGDGGRSPARIQPRSRNGTFDRSAKERQRRRMRSQLDPLGLRSGVDTRRKAARNRQCKGRNRRAEADLPRRVPKTTLFTSSGRLLRMATNRRTQRTVLLFPPGRTPVRLGGDLGNVAERRESYGNLLRPDHRGKRTDGTRSR